MPDLEPVTSPVTAVQDALLPTRLPVLPRLALAARYLLADASNPAGGDWFDAAPLPDGRVALVVGDVAGRGIEAAAAMGRLQAVLAERLGAGRAPVDAIRDLDRYARAVPEAEGATVCAVVFDPDGGDLEYVLAGHPPPLVVDRSGHSRFLSRPRGRPLGTDGGGFETGADALGADEVILLYSNGLLRRRATTPAQSATRLSRMAGTVATERPLPGLLGAQGLDQLCDRILEAMADEAGPEDDIALLVAEPRTVSDELVRTVPATRENVRTVRAELDGWLTDLGAGVLEHVSILHAFVEVAGNAVEHAYSTASASIRDLTVEARLHANGRLMIGVRDRGQWRGDGNGDGRGLMMAGGLVHRLRVRPGETGTTVTLEERLGHPVQILETPHAAGRGAAPGRRAEGETTDITATTGEVTVKGMLDSDNADQFRAAVLEASHAGSRDATVDLNRVTYLGSAAVAALFEMCRRSHDNDRTLTLVATEGTPAHHILDLVALAHTG